MIIAVELQSRLGYIVGGVLLAGGAVMITLGALKSKKEKESPTASSTSCGVGFASATCRVRF